MRFAAAGVANNALDLRANFKAPVTSPSERLRWAMASARWASSLLLSMTQWSVGGKEGEEGGERWWWEVRSVRGTRMVRVVDATPSGAGLV